MRYLLFVSGLFLLLLSSCEKENLQPQLDALSQEVTLEKKKDPLCVYNDGVVRVREFLLCGKKYYFQGELRIANHNTRGYIQAIGKCYRPGNPVQPINAEIEIETWGQASISCKLPINITLPTEYNSNLQNGEVPNHIYCPDCSSATTTIQYWKAIALSPLDQINTKITLRLEACGEVIKETIELDSTQF